LVHSSPLKGATVLKMNHADRRLRIIFVFGAFCNTLWSKTDTKASNLGTLISSEKSACTTQWMCVVFDTAREYATATNPTLKANRSLSRPINRNILFGFAMFQHDVLNNHTSKKPAALKAKGWIDGKSHFGEDFNGLRKHGNFKIVSLAGRRKIQAGLKLVHLDKFFQLSIICLLSRATDRVGFEARMKEAIATVLKQDRLDDEASLSAGTSSKRRTYFIQSGIMFGDGMLLFKTMYDSQRVNPGNNSSHNSSSSSTMDSVTRQLQPRFNDSSWFFLQATGSSSVDKGPTWPDGRPFSFPEDGTIIKSKPGSNEPDVKFRESDVVTGIAYGGLLERLNNRTNGTGKTKTKKVEKKPEYEARYNNGMMTYTSNNLQYINKYNVVEVQLVKSSEVTTTQTGRKPPSSDSKVQVEYEQEFETAVAHLVKKGTVDKASKPWLVVLLWCGFGVGQGQSSPYRKDTKKKTAPELRVMLKERVAKNADWIEDTRRKLNAKKAVKTEE